MAAAEAAPVVPIDDVRTQLAKMEAQMSADASFQLSPEGAQLQQRAMEVEELTKLTGKSWPQRTPKSKR